MKKYILGISIILFLSSCASLGSTQIKTESFVHGSPYDACSLLNILACQSFYPVEVKTKMHLVLDHWSYGRYLFQLYLAEEKHPDGTTHYSFRVIYYGYHHYILYKGFLRFLCQNKQGRYFILKLPKKSVPFLEKVPVPILFPNIPTPNIGQEQLPLKQQVYIPVTKKELKTIEHLRNWRVVYYTPIDNLNIPAGFHQMYNWVQIMFWTNEQQRQQLSEAIASLNLR